jgi:hypothetical protein
MKNDLVMKMGSDGSFVVDEEATKRKSFGNNPCGEIEMETPKIIPANYYRILDDIISEIKNVRKTRKYYTI